MTPELQRIKIAEACGWTDIRQDAACTVEGMLRGCRQGERLFVPDYLKDLNAMHEAEKSIAPFLQDAYWLYLFKAVTGVAAEPPNTHNEFSHFEVSTATAAQRAEAFLRTLNLWL